MNTNLTSISRRQALALAAALTLAVGTAVGAVAGIAHTPTPAASSPTITVPVSQTAPPAQEVDD